MSLSYLYRYDADIEIVSKAMKTSFKVSFKPIIIRHLSMIVRLITNLQDSDCYVDCYTHNSV